MSVAAPLTVGSPHSTRGTLVVAWVVVLLASGLDAFTEEVTYKASLLSVLECPLGPRQAVLSL